MFKSIVYLPNFYCFYGGPHKPKVKGRAQIIYSDGTAFFSSHNYLCVSPLVINHYWYRSEAYYYNVKKETRKVFDSAGRSEALEKSHMALCNSVFDDTILAFAKQIDCEI